MNSRNDSNFFVHQPSKTSTSGSNLVQHSQAVTRDAHHHVTHLVCVYLVQLQCVPVLLVDEVELVLVGDTDLVVVAHCVDEGHQLRDLERLQLLGTNARLVEATTPPHRRWNVEYSAMAPWPESSGPSTKETRIRIRREYGTTWDGREWNYTGWT